MLGIFGHNWCFQRLRMPSVCAEEHESLPLALEQGASSRTKGRNLMTESALDYSRYFWQGARVRLRPLRMEDAEQSFADSLDSPSRQLLQLGTELPTSIELQRSSLEKYVGCKETDGVILFAIESLGGCQVGGVSLHSRDDRNGRFSFGIIIGRDHRRKGYAEEAVRILLRYGFWERRYQKCNSACAHTNEGSIALHRKLGFVEEGRRRRQLFFHGQYHDDILFGMTPEEFDTQEKVRASVEHSRITQDMHSEASRLSWLLA